MIKNFSKKSKLGFTLIEMIIVIGIIGILAAIAYPSYMMQIRESRRTAAKTALFDLASREARYYSTNNAFCCSAAAMATLGYAGAGTAAGSIAIPTTTQHYYDLTVTLNTTGFVASAVPVGDQASDTYCASYSLDNYGQKTVTGTGSNCW